MKPAHILPIAATLSLALLAACSKPASTTVDETAATTTATTADAAASTADATAMAAGGATDPGGAVSPPQANGAVNTDANTNATDTAAASNSFTEGQAKDRAVAAGYTDIATLAKDNDGIWRGTAKKGSAPVNVAVDFKGNVVSQ